MIQRGGASPAIVRSSTAGKRDGQSGARGPGRAGVEKSSNDAAESGNVTCKAARAAPPAPHSEGGSPAYTSVTSALGPFHEPEPPTQNTIGHPGLSVPV